MSESDKVAEASEGVTEVNLFRLHQIGLNLHIVGTKIWVSHSGSQWHARRPALRNRSIRTESFGSQLAPKYFLCYT